MNAININKTKLENDGQIVISTGTSSKSKTWKTNQVTLSSFISKIKNPIRTQETLEEFKAMNKTEKNNAKDVGGFVGGALKGGRRIQQNVANRQVVTLDADFGYDGFLENIDKALNDYAYSYYSTRTHSEKLPKYRVLVYLAEPVLNDEYQAIATKLAEMIDIEAFDDTTYQPHRLMYWGSVSADSDNYIFHHNDKPFLNGDVILAKYDVLGGWEDSAKWPHSSRMEKTIKGTLTKAGNPLEKAGIVGAFNRSHTIYEALEMLPDVYIKESAERYTYLQGTSTNGLVIYEGLFSYSNHATDPAGQKLCNAFDLIRLHMFGDLDKDQSDETPYNRLHSFTAMNEKFGKDKSIAKERVLSNIDLLDELDTDEEPNYLDDLDGGDAVNIQPKKQDTDWVTELQMTDKDEIKPTLFNAGKIVEKFHKVSNLMRYNLFSEKLENFNTGEQWKETDSTKLRMEVGKVFKVDFPEAKIGSAVELQAEKNAYHPVKDYLTDLKWDGIERIETLFVDLLNSADNIYTREVTKCFFTAAVARIFEPGFKFDNMVVIEGFQGARKSSFIKILSSNADWFVELNSFDNKIATEIITGKWLVELPELNAVNRHEVEIQKAFLSSSSTTVRPAYARYSREFKRQSVFIGTTNESTYLKDPTGNRRYWPIHTNKNQLDPIDTDLLETMVDQLWAEAVELYVTDYGVELGYEALKIAVVMQEGRVLEDSWKGIIIEYLESEADENRYNSKDYVFQSNPMNSEDRKKVCIREIWFDCLGQKNEPKQVDNTRITAILSNLENWEKKNTIRFGARFGTQRGFTKI